MYLIIQVAQLFVIIEIESINTLEIRLLYNAGCMNYCDENDCAGYTCDIYILYLGCDNDAVKAACEKACGLCENGE